MLNEDELKNELARRLISRFFSNEKSFEENLKNAEFEEGFLKNLANQLLNEVGEVGVGGKEKKETNRQTGKEEDLGGERGIRPKILVAEILVEALPYIQEFYGKTVVVKYGGNAMINDELKEKVMQDIALMKYTGINVVIVHGGGPEITGFLKKLGKETSFVSGLRVTDEETVEIAEMVLAGKINSEIVMLLNRRGVRAVGISGKDADLIHAEKKLATVYEQGEKTKVDIGYVGKTKKIDIRIVKDLISSGYVPVIAPIGVGEDGESYNINADYVAADIAGALKAEKLLLLTDTEGVYKDFNDKSSFISTLTASEAREYIKSGVIAGGMVPKVEACLRTLQGGTGKAHIIDGRLPHSIILELFTASGIGTQVE